MAHFKAPFLVNCMLLGSDRQIGLQIDVKKKLNIDIGGVLVITILSLVSLIGYVNIEVCKQ